MSWSQIPLFKICQTYTWPILVRSMLHKRPCTKTRDSLLSIFLTSFVKHGTTEIIAMTSKNTGRSNSIKHSFRKLFNKPNETAGTQLPPGGLPLPAVVRRKFSFAPQLSEASLVSLLPDFSSGHNREQGAQAGYMESQIGGIAGISRLPCTQYSLVPPKDETPKSRDPKARHMLRRKKAQEFRKISNSPNGTDARSEESSPLAVVYHGERLSQSPVDTFSQDTSGSATLGPMSSLSPKASTISIATKDPERHHISEQQILTLLTENVPNLLDPYCAIDLRISRQIRRVTSHGTKPPDYFSEYTTSFIPGQDLDSNWEVRTQEHGSRQSHHLTMQGDLVESGSGRVRSKQRVIIQVDVTDLIIHLEANMEPDPSTDIWMEIAHEAMRASGIRQSHLNTSTLGPKVPSMEMESALRFLRHLHRDYMLISSSSGASGSPKTHAITHFSPSLSKNPTNPTNPKQRNLPNASLFDIDDLRESLDRGERFVSVSRCQRLGFCERLYCLPLSGPDLEFWLCFLVDGDLPGLWTRT